jgi:non-ribosomal peptide synthase protein (TIGR01720 family)
MVAHTRGGGFGDAAATWSGGSEDGLTIAHDPGAVVGETCLLRTALDRDTTRRLLYDVARPRRLRFDAVLVSGLARALRPWAPSNRITLELEGHGRATPGAEDLNILESVGWFTSLFPASLDLAAMGGARAALGAVEEHLSALPHNGDSFGWLRYYDPDPRVRSMLAALGEPPIAFNYAGQFDHLARSHGAFRQQPYPPGQLQSSRAHRSRMLEINTFILGEVLHLEWSCNGDAATVAMTKAVALATSSHLSELANGGG